METTENQDIIYALAADFSRRKLFVARGSGLYTSNDEGRSWSYAYQSFLGSQPLPTLCVALSPAFERDHTILAGTPGAVLCSRDGGTGWEIYRFELPAPAVSGIAFSPNFERDGTAFLITLEDGVYCSYDNGSSWNNWNFGLLDANGISIAVSPNFAQDRAVFAGTSSGVFCSENGGKSWEGLDLPGGFDAVTALAVSPAYPQDHTIFAGSESNGLYRSSGGGKTWEAVGQGMDDNPIYAILLSPDFATSAKLAALVGPALMLSDDGGAQFTAWLEDKIPAQFEITAVCAPSGFERGMKLFVGGTGRVIGVEIGR